MEIDMNTSILCIRFGDSISLIREVVLEFEKIPNNTNMIDTFPYMESVYMNWIITNLHKLVSVSKCDEYRLSKFENCFGKEISDKVVKIKCCHKELIEKINNNRNRFTAHIDKNCTDMKFSTSEVKKLETKFETKMPELESKDKANERYSAQDLQDDLVEIKILLNECDLIWKSVLDFVSKM